MRWLVIGMVALVPWSARCGAKSPSDLVPDDSVAADVADDAIDGPDGVSDVSLAVDTGSPVADSTDALADNEVHQDSISHEDSDSTDSDSDDARLAAARWLPSIFLLQ